MRRYGRTASYKSPEQWYMTTMRIAAERSALSAAMFSFGGVTKSLSISRAILRPKNRGIFPETRVPVGIGKNINIDTSKGCR